MATKRIAVLTFLTMFCLALPTFAQHSKRVTKGPLVISEFKHDTGPLLREIAPLLPEFSLPSEHEIRNNDNPRNPWKYKPVLPDPVLQTAENSPTLQTPTFSLEFDGLGVGDQFFCNCEPPDNDGAPGTTQYVQYINTSYGVWDKSGNMVLGPLAGNSFWSGFGGSCQTDNSGDPIVRFDAAAQRWVVSQFAINNAGNDFECVAVSTTSDATGSYNRYAFSFANFPDYPKMSVWPDAYYFTFNNFNLAGNAFVGANVCAADRTKMIAGSAATLQCFQQSSSDFGMLPSDLDGPTAPPPGTPNFVMELDPDGSANLSMFKFHVDFTNPSNSTFTGPTLIPVAAFTPLCPTQVRGRCVPQPGSLSDLLESLGNRLMYRLVYRNFGDHTTLLASHSIVSGTSGGLRWYEIHNPETSPTMFQSGTFAPTAQYRWMPAIAMDANQDIAVGFSRSSTTSGDFPSLVYAGRVPSDAAGTLESEVTLKAGAGSQNGGGHRWGDYTSMTIDPVDDCTFWFTEEYEKTTGGFNWSTAIGTFTFPGCGGGGGPAVTLSPTSLTFASTVVGVTSGAKTVTVTNSGTATLSISSITTSGDFAQKIVAQSCGSTLAVGKSCKIEVTFTPTQVGARTGSLVITDNAPDSPQTVPLSGIGAAQATLTPATKKFPAEKVGTSSPAVVFTLSNKQKVALTSIAISTTGDFAVSSTTCTTSLAAKANCKISVTFTPTATGTRTGTLKVADSAVGSPQTSSLTGTGK